MVNNVKNKTFAPNDKIFLGTVDEETAKKIYDLTGINVENFKMAIEARQVEHILKDHGESGKSDRSMANASDIARLEFTLFNYDDLRLSGKSHAYKNVINGTTQASLTVLYEKNIGEKSYYAIQAVPDTKAKTLFIVTSFIGKQGYKKEVSQFINANSLDVTSEIEIATPSINIIPPTDEKINTSDEKNSNSLYDKDPPIADNVGKQSQDELRATLEAKADPDVPIDDNAGGHVVHLDNEVIDPKKENGALGKGASVDEEIQADKGLLKFINDIEQMQDKSLLSKRSYNIGLISENHRILLECLFKNEFNIEHNFSGYSMQINGSAVSHIQKRHGKNGNADQTMANDEDIAKLGIIANSADEFEVLRKADGSIDTSAEFRNKKGERSPKIALKKSINNNTFVVIECVPESNKKTIHIVSARKEKGGIGQVLNIEANASPQLTSKTPVDYPATTNIIPENTEKVNTLDEKNSKPLNDEDPPIADNNGKQSQDELRAELEAKVKDVIENYRTDPRALAEYVIFCSRFNNYSANNLRLIWAQYPHAQFVTSAYDFSHGLPDKDGKPTISEKIFIKKGEHALRIWKPYDVKYTVMPDGTEKRSAWLTKSEREQAKAEKWKELKRTFFTLVPVFDITQTTASPDVYPKLCGLGGIADATSEKIFKGISDYCKYELNCPVIVRDFGERKATVRGLYYPERNEIHISDMLEGENKRSTTLHEAGHAILRLYNYLNQNDSVALSEYKADAIAISIETALGVTLTDARCRHLKAHYDKYLAERNVSDISADDEVFNDVIKICREQMPTIIEYINNSMLTQAQSTEQTETQRNDAHITPKRTV